MKLMLSDLADNFQTTMKKQVQGLAVELRKDIAEIGQCTTHVEQRLNECADAHNGLTEKVQEYEITMHSLKTKIADLEDRSRRNNIRIRGILETVLPTGLNDYLQDMFQALTPAIHPDQLVVDRVHRLRRPQHLPATAERDVIARIHFFHAKELIMKASRTAEMPDPYGNLSAETLQYRKNLAQITTTL
ncbi:Hypothetical predicted protein [Pelobates cultripes]|uniref:Uncharacterized protein n=1 Tax=Pelobates cultripes TaxID=61616 RepID=A0AAD1R647_PELCU|nr:Hypothetical predicted protein [Pelobates cultripes]